MQPGRFALKFALALLLSRDISDPTEMSAISGGYVGARRERSECLARDIDHPNVCVVCDMCVMNGKAGEEINGRKM